MARQSARRLPSRIVRSEARRPAEIRGDIKPIKTNLRIMRIAEVMPEMAKHADKIAHSQLSPRQRRRLSGPSIRIVAKPTCRAVYSASRVWAVWFTSTRRGRRLFCLHCRPGPPNTNMFVPTWLMPIRTHGAAIGGVLVIASLLQLIYAPREFDPLPGQPMRWLTNDQHHVGRIGVRRHVTGDLAVDALGRIRRHV